MLIYINIRALFQLVALLGTKRKQQHLLNSTLTLPKNFDHLPPRLPLTILFPWDYPPVYIGIYRSS